MTDGIQQGFAWCLPDNAEDSSVCLGAANQEPLKQTNSGWGSMCIWDLVFCGTGGFVGQVISQ